MAGSRQAPPFAADEQRPVSRFVARLTRHFHLTSATPCTRQTCKTFCHSHYRPNTWRRWLRRCWKSYANRQRESILTDA